MLRVAIATCAEEADNEDDRLLAEALSARGCQVSHVVWDDPTADWSGFDRIVIRSTWGYHEKPDEYLRWLDGFRSRPGRLRNPPEMVAANVHKGYLLDLERAGIPIVPTEFVPAGSDVSLVEILARRGWSRAVFKPAISAGAANTREVDGDAEAWEAGFRELVACRDMLVQPFLDEIRGEGEWSLIFLDGRFSHAIVKTPAEGDFRVQTEHGGTFRAAEPGPDLIERAGRVVGAIGSVPTLARVDGVVRDGRFLLLELEINEPYLGLGLAPGSADRLADAVLAEHPPARGDGKLSDGERSGELRP